MGYTHGINRGCNSKHELRSTYYNMIARCFNKKYWKYERYGGRGITVCDRWAGEGGFINFIKDMGTRPKGYQLDRLNNDGNYSPSNCRWVSKYTQMSNTSNTKGVVGVGWHKQRGKWRARIKVNGVDKSLGLYNTKEEAIKARKDYVYTNNCI